MKITLLDPESKYEIDCIDLDSYDLESEGELELLKNDILEIILEYAEGEM